jgi:hypothetical protein
MVAPLVLVAGQTFTLDDDDELSRELFVSGHYPLREFRVDEQQNLWIGPHCRVDLLLCIARGDNPQKSADSRLGQAFSVLPTYEPEAAVAHLNGDPRDLRAANLVAPPPPVYPQAGPRFGATVKKLGYAAGLRCSLVKDWLSAKIYGRSL